MEQSPTKFARIRAHLPFLLVLGLYVVVAAWLSFRLPAFATPNEPLHYEYVALIRRTGTLPDAMTSTRMDERHQPPLYYGLVSLLSMPVPEPPLDTELEPNPYLLATPGGGNRNSFIGTSPREVPALYVGRMVSVMFGALACIAFYYGTSKTVSSPIALLAVSLMAFQPMYLFLSASLSNDLAVTAMAAIILAYSAMLIARDWGWAAYFVWGALFSLALLTKATAAFLAIVLGIVLVAKWRASGSILRTLRYGLAAIVGFLPIYSCWMLFNWVRGLDALGISRSLPLGSVLRVSPLEWAMVRPHFGTLWQSFWLDWSTGTTGYVADWFYILWALVLVLALAGWAIRRHRLAVQPFLPWMYLLWILPLTAMFVSVKVLMIRDHNVLVPEGRWLLPILPSLAWLAAVGFGRWWPASFRDKATLLAAAVPVLGTTVLLLWFIPRQHPNAQQLSELSSIPSSAEPVGLIYDGELELVAIEPVEIAAGQPTRMPVYWHVLKDIESNYTVESALVLASPDKWHKRITVKSYPGFGLAPTRGWRQGQVYRDAIVLNPDASLNGPTRALIEVNLLDGEDRLPAIRHGQESDSGVAFSTVVRPPEPLTPAEQTLLRQPVNFGGLIELISVEKAFDDNGLKLILWWHALADLHSDYTVFVHMLDERGQLIDQADSMPNSGLSPTTLWQSGDVTRDEYRLPAVSGTGQAAVIGLYDLSTMERLTASQGGQSLTDKAYRVDLP